MCVVVAFLFAFKMTLFVSRFSLNLPVTGVGGDEFCQGVGQEHEGIRRVRSRENERQQQL